MWFGEPDMTKVLFGIQTNSRMHDTQYNKPKCGKESFH